MEEETLGGTSLGGYLAGSPGSITGMIREAPGAIAAKIPPRSSLV